MRVLVVSDIHANLVALEAVIRDASAGGSLDAIWSLGDCVGYGPQPAECLALLSEEGAAAVAGNHERAATGAISADDFNPDARAAILWTGNHLSDADKITLDEMPETRVEAEQFTLVHGTLRWPVWEYLYTVEAGKGHLELQETPFGFCGHTHVPALATLDEGAPGGCKLRRLGGGEIVALNPAQKIVINPGSVGQPRDGDPRASCALYDSGSGSVAVHRVEYDIAKTQRLMEEENLPPWLIKRLAEGR